MIVVDYFESVFKIVEKIPAGKVTTYGHIAQAIGLKSGARMVGYALNKSLEGSASELPCHRVVNRNGELTGKAYFGGNTMKERLLQEKVSFLDEDRVDLNKHLWIP